MLAAPVLRYYTISFLTLVQSIKLYGWFVHDASMTSSQFFFQWLIIDMALILVIHFLRIPWLYHSRLVTLIILCLSAMVNLTLANNLTMSFWNVLSLLPSYDVGISRNAKVNLQSLVQNKSNIDGKFTIVIIPESKDKNVHVPLVFNMSSFPPTQVKYTRFYQEELSTHIVQGTDLKEALKHHRGDELLNTDSKSLKTIYLRFDQPGNYKVLEVLDADQIRARIYKSQYANVVDCPSASINTLPSFKCMGDILDFKVKVFGLSPLKVTYTITSEKDVKHKTLENIVPRKSESEIVKYNYESLTPSSIEIDLDHTLHAAGELGIFIESVQDRLGNIIHIQTPQIPKVSVKKIPYINFVGCDLEKPITLFEGKQANLLLSSNIQLNGPKDQNKIKSVDGNDALSVEMEVQDNNGNTRKEKIDDIGQIYPISQPGKYSLLSIASKYCQGHIRNPSSCLVHTPPKPVVEVKFEEIQDKCAGSIGLLADLVFTKGTPPFWVQYRVWRGSTKVNDDRIKVERSRHTMRFSPEKPGQYMYEFFAIMDENYKNIPVTGAAFKKKQTFHPLASAKFVKDFGARQICKGSHANFKVHFAGSGPWTLHYEYANETLRQKETVQSTNEFVTISSPQLNSGGKHTITLVNVVDNTGCETAIEEPDLIFEVRRESPTASFGLIANQRSLTASKGERVHLPLHLTGVAPWRINYNVKDVHGKVSAKTETISSSNKDLVVREAGVYELISVQDASCPGLIEIESKDFTVTWYAYPTLRFADDNDRNTETGSGSVSTCEGVDAYAEIEMEGVGPFQISYSRNIVGSSDHENLQHFDLDAPLPYAAIRLPGQEPGSYEYKLTEIGDAHYSKTKIPGHKGKLPSLTHHINKHPVAVFEDTSKRFTFCPDKADDSIGAEETIPIRLSGIGPFTIGLYIKHETTGRSQSFVIDNIITNPYHLIIPKEVTTPGSHLIYLKNVTDNSGCTNSLFKKPIAVTVAERPNISPLDLRTDRCVGERLTYAIQGVPSFDVTYEFNSKKHVATVKHGTFSRVADRPGNLTITHLADHGHQCKIKLSPLTAIIHQIPSVRVQKGSNVIESIHEGDQAEIVFIFTGTPPFSFSYSVSSWSSTKKNKGQVLETHTVTDVNDYTHSIFTSQQGSYEIIQGIFIQR